MNISRIKRNRHILRYNHFAETNKKVGEKMTKKKKLMFPMKCSKCGKEPIKEKSNEWEVIKLNCTCGGRVETDFTKPYYE